MHYRKKLKYDFGGIWTPYLCCSFATNKPLSHSVSHDWNLKPWPLLFIYKGETTEQLGERWLGGLVEHNKHNYFVSVKTPYLLAVEHHHTTSKSTSTQILKPSDFRSPEHKTNQFRSLNWNQAKFDPPHRNQVNIDHPDNQVNFDPHTKTERFTARIQKPRPFRLPPPTHKNKKTSQSIIALKTS